VTEYETDPGVWWTRLLRALTASGTEMDEEILAARPALCSARTAGQGTSRVGSRWL
jgi:hypothetical protein